MYIIIDLYAHFLYQWRVLVHLVQQRPSVSFHYIKKEADPKGQNNSLRIEYSETRLRLTSPKNKKKGLD